MSSEVAPGIAAFIERVKHALHKAPLEVFADPEANAPGQITGYHEVPDFVAQRQSATKEDDLTLTVFAAVATTLTLTGLIKRPDGTTVPIGPNGAGFTVNVLADRVPRSTTFARSSGVEIFGLNVATSTKVPIGAVWAIVQRSRVLADASTALTAVLLSGPVSSTQPLGWPGSPVQTSQSVPYALTVTAAPINATTTLQSVPANARWDPMSAEAPVVLQGAAGNRLLVFQALDATGAIVKCLSPAPAFSVANSGQTITAGAGFPSMASPLTGTFGHILVPFPIGLSMNATDKLGFTIENPQANDQWGQLAVHVLERLDP